MISTKNIPCLAGRFLVTGSNKDNHLGVIRKIKHRSISYKSTIVYPRLQFEPSITEHGHGRHFTGIYPSEWTSILVTGIHNNHF